MKGQTKKFYLLLIILSLIALFSISCNNDNNNKDKTGAEEINKDKTEKEEVKKKENYLIMLVIGMKNQKRKLPKRIYLP